MNKEHKNNRKAIKKALRLLLLLLLCILLIPLLVAALLLIPSVQRGAVKLATHYATEYIGSEISLGGIYLEPFRTIRLDEVLIRDINADTLIYAEAIYLELTRFDRNTGNINLNLVEVEEGYFNLYSLPGDSLMNLDHFINAFPASTDTTRQGEVVIECDEVVLHRLRFSYHDGDVARAAPGAIDFDHLDIQGLSGRISDVSIHSDSIMADIHGLHFSERSGFELRYLSGKAVVSSTVISCNEMTLVTNRSVINGNYAMHSKSWADYSDFLKSISLESQLVASDVNFQDIAFFAPEVRDILTPMQFSGRVSGSISNLKATVDSLRFADSGWLQGKVKLKGLPEINSTFIDADLKALHATVADVQQINIPSADSVYRLKLPQEVMRIAYVDFAGKFTGFISDFVAFGEASTALGTLRADINVKSSGERLNYSGQLASPGFALGTLLDVGETVQDIAFDLDIKGRGVEFKTMSVEARGNVSSLGVLGYTYRNISVDGLLDQRLFEGNVAVRDTNIILDFSGRVDMNGKIPQVNCVSEIGRLQLANLNLVPEDTFGMASGRLTLNMEGNSLHNLHGQLSLYDAVYENRTTRVALDTCLLTDKLTGNGHDIRFTSDLLSMHITGNTDLFSLPYAIIKVSRTYAPGMFHGISLEGQDTLQAFDFTITLKNERELIAMFTPDLKIDSAVHITGSINSMNNEFALAIDSLDWVYGNLAFTGNTVNIHTAEGTLHADLNATRITVSEDYFLESFAVDAGLRNDSVNTQVSWRNQTEQADSGYLSLTLYRSDAFPFNAVLNAMEVKVAGVVWRSEERAMLNADTNNIIISDLQLVSPTGYITCNGRISKGSEEHLLFDIANFDLAYLSNFGLGRTPLHGIFNGTIDMYERSNAFVADVDLSIDSMAIDVFEVGTVRGNSRYSEQTRGLTLNLDLDYKGERNISLQGDYYPFRDEDQLDIEASLNAFRLNIIEPFVADYLSSIEGEMNGSLSISGNIDAPKLNGSVRLDRFKGLVQYLNTYYTIPTAEVKVSPDLLALDAVQVLDEKGEKAELTMSLFHENFSDFTYDIFIDAHNFLCLNTTVVQNEMYYGRANITGDISISGYPGNTLIEVVASTNRGTQLSIPLDQGGSVSDLEYIRFVEPGGETRKIVQRTVLEEELSGLELDFQLSVNDEAEVQIIFDEKIGDIIKVRGNGDMLMKIDNRGKFNMYGVYVITSGDYLFTLQNIINKRFGVQSGSKIAWSGSPYDAEVDLAAIYRLRASPAGLPGIDSSAVYKQRMPVDVYLNMKGDLLEPYISFDVDLPSLPESDLANQLLDPATTSEQDLNRQVFSLLLINNFAGSSNTATLGGVGRSTSYEMLSNQFSNWISQYFDNVDIGVNLRKGDQNTTDQGEVSVSTELFKDRVLVQVNGSVQGNTQSTSQANNNVAGEFNVEYKIDKDGSLRARVFNEANNYNPTNLNQSPYTQGVGVFYREEFDTVGEFFKGLFGKGKKKKKKQMPDPPLDPEAIQNDEEEHPGEDPEQQAEPALPQEEGPADGGPGRQ